MDEGSESQDGNLSRLFRTFARVAEKQRDIASMKIEKIVRALMGKPEIYFANMGHGETIAFELNGQWYLRDFGESASRRGNQAQCSISKILQPKGTCVQCKIPKFISAANKWDAVISHFHDDHVRGFKELYNMSSRKIFRNAFMPAIYLQGNIADANYFLLYIEANLHIYCFAKQDKYRRNALHFLTMPIIMDELAEQTFYIHRDNSVSVFPGTVLCPGDSLVLDDYRNGYSIDKILNSYCRGCEEALIKDFRNTAEKIKNILEPHMRNVSENNVGRNNRHDYDSIKSEIISLCQKHRNPSQNVRFLQHAVKGSVDDRSLVFDVSFPSNNKIDVLFLGDNNDASLRRISENFKEHYDYIKADHHGSRGGKVMKKYFSIKPPLYQVKTTVCCCGMGHRSGEVNPEYSDLSTKVLWTEKKKTWIDSNGSVIGKCTIGPGDLN